MVKKLVEMHGGQVSARSEGVGHGSEFTVRLPCAMTTVAFEAAAIQLSDNLRQRPATRLRVLIADDNADALQGLTLLVGLAGHDVIEAADGMEALNLAQAHRPHVALLDIGMPKMNGYEVAKRIRAEPWGSRIIVAAISGWGQVSDRTRAAEAGFDHHFVKPVDFTAIEQLFAGVLDSELAEDCAKDRRP